MGMVEQLRFRLKAKRLLYWDSFWNALPIHRVFFAPESVKDVFVDRMDDPRALMTTSFSEPVFISMVGRNEEALLTLLDFLEGGKEYRFHAVDRNIANLIRERFDVFKDDPSWLYVLPKRELRGEVRHEVTPLRAEDAETINEYWNPGEDSTRYIRSRIEKGLAFGIRVDGELVAWDATHLETDNAVMLGFLYVKDGFRKMGFALSITTTMGNTVLQKRKTPICHIFKDNEPSIRFTEEMGFKRRGEQVWIRAVKP
jgi:RimJ/RimL family protein N-acetyltransferase